MVGCIVGSNNHKNPTIEKFYRILMSYFWEDIFRLTSVRKLAREISDIFQQKSHFLSLPPLLNIDDSKPVLIPSFEELIFDLNWLKSKPFLPLVAKFWWQPVKYYYHINIVNIKIKRLKKVGALIPLGCL